MVQLAAGLILFLGVHSLRLFAEGWRSRLIARWGEGLWKGIYSLVSLLGLVLIVRGYGEARQMPEILWVSPLWLRHLTVALTLPAFVLVLAAYLPGSVFKVRLGHPMLAGVKIWAFAHLLANGTQADLLLFGSFLVWAVSGFVIHRRRDRLADAARADTNLTGAGQAAILPYATIKVLLIGTVIWLVFAGFLHQLLIGVYPF